jgi:glycosyltransferase involved in cell wall biosynthesis
MKIVLFVYRFFPRYQAGTEILSLELARELRELGHMVYIVAGDSQFTENKYKYQPISHVYLSDFDCFNVFRIKCSSWRMFSIFNNPFHYQQRIIHILDLLNEIKPDIVHFLHIMDFPVEIIPAIKKMGIPVFFTPTDFWVICPKVILYRYKDQKICEGPGKDGKICLGCYYNTNKDLFSMVIWTLGIPLHILFKPIEHVYVLKNRKQRIICNVNAADLILPATNFLAKMLISHGVQESKVSVLPYGINMDVYTVSMKKTNHENLRIGFIGTLSPHKGAHVLVESLKYLDKRYDGISVEIYGHFDDTDSYCSYISSIAKELEKIKVDFKGTFPHNEIGLILDRFDVLVIPSIWYEDAPLVLCSALMNKTPVLVSHLGGLTEIVTENYDGFSFPPNNPRALASLLQRFLDNPDLAGHLRSRMTSKIKNMKEYALSVESVYKKNQMD